MQIIDGAALLIDTDEPELITDRIKKSADTAEGVAVHWDFNSASVLASLRFADTPSPILRDYNWPGRYAPFDHQRTTASFLSLRERAFCFSELGTGKTASVIWAADYLMKLGVIKRVLVVCPLSIMKCAWQADLFNFAMHRSCGVAHGSAEQRIKVIESGAEFVIINYDGLEVVQETIMAGGFDLIVADECTYLKTATTRRWKVFKKVMDALNPRLWMLTGTPAAQAPTDAYGLAKLVNPDGCPRLYSAFRDKVMYKVSHFKWAAKPQAEDYLHKVLQPAIRFEKKECLDLPEVTHVTREAPLTAMQAKYYKKLKTELLLEAAGEQISAVNAATAINKLLQISGGAVYTDSREVIEFDVSNRINAVLEVIEEAANKVLVFVPFTHTIELLAKTLEKAGITYGVINGAVSLNKRSGIVERFQNASDPHVLIIQPQAASHGLTLTAADTIIWYAPVTSVETYLQANGRIDRPGQKNTMTIVHIKGSEVEHRLYDMLQGNIDTHEKLIDLYRMEMNGA